MNFDFFIIPFTDEDFRPRVTLALNDRRNIALKKRKGKMNGKQLSIVQKVGAHSSLVVLRFWPHITLSLCSQMCIFVFVLNIVFGLEEDGLTAARSSLHSWHTTHHGKLFLVGLSLLRKHRSIFNPSSSIDCINVAVREMVQYEQGVCEWSLSPLIPHISDLMLVLPCRRCQFQYI